MTTHVARHKYTHTSKEENKNKRFIFLFLCVQVLVLTKHKSRKLPHAGKSMFSRRIISIDVVDLAGTRDTDMLKC